jgi:hypothetical protein
MCNEDVKCKLVSFAESVHAEVKFDMDFKVEPYDFFRAKFKNDQFQAQKITKAIYKYYVSGN